MKRLPILWFRSFCSHFLGQLLLRGGDPKLRVFTSRQSYVTWHCSIINCWARSTLRALLRMAVPPVLSSTYRVVSSRQLRRLTIAPRRGEGRALRFVPSEVPHGPRSPPNAMCRACLRSGFSFTAPAGRGTPPWPLVQSPAGQTEADGTRSAGSGRPAC